MHHTNVPNNYKHKVFPKAFETATLLDELVVTKINGMKKSRLEHFAGAIPKFASHLRTWGEAGTIKIYKKTTPKINVRGVTCIFMGYTTKHEGDYHEMWDPKQ
eukprot:557773-Ditylum_brightwellii.AAC.1